MSFKTLLTYWDGEAASSNRVEAAVALARMFDAHLNIVAFGYEPDIPSYAPAAAMTDFYGRAREDAEAMVKEAEAFLETADVKAEARSAVSTYSGLAFTFGAMARFADLVVLDQPYGATYEEAAVNLLEGAMLDGDAPALICPRPMQNRPATVLIGWNDSREALRAVRRSLPFLIQADRVEIAIVEPGRSEATPGEDLALMLARHGVPVEVNPLAKTTETTSAALRQRAIDLDADLMVMGAYGHSRFREYVLGGVTREILEDVPVPVLMAH